MAPTFISDRSDMDCKIETHKLPKAIRMIALMSCLALLTIVTICFRDELSNLAFLGYPAIVLACFLMNCGVFGLSPSGLVAVELSFVYNPLVTAMLAGIGAGAGEITSYLAGAASNEIASNTDKRLLGHCGNLKYSVIIFVASLISGNLSDAVGIMAGRADRNPALFLGAATSAKVLKFLILIYLAHTTSASC